MILENYSTMEACLSNIFAVKLKKKIKLLFFTIWFVLIRAANEPSRTMSWLTPTQPSFLIGLDIGSKSNLTKNQVRSGPWLNFLIQWIIQVRSSPCITRPQSIKYMPNSGFVRIESGHGLYTSKLKKNFCSCQGSKSIMNYHAANKQGIVDNFIQQTEKVRHTNK